ncbi:MAG TPA: hypothetical protein VGM78_07310 [Ilumatobacteraceae bacterium]|jgi:hypothetical protein
MADIIFVSITIAFFVICVFYVNWCDRIIGPDETGEDGRVSEREPEHETAGARS